MRILRLGTALITALALAPGGFLQVPAASAASPSAPTTPRPRPTVFFDDFDGAELDRGLWNVQVTAERREKPGDPTFVPLVNKEQQAYIDSPDVIYIDRDTRATGARNGALALHPRYRPGRKVGGDQLDFVSGRITTQDHAEFTYGSMTARMKLPARPGLWPAFWALGANIDDPGRNWPICGEIDVMENIGDPAWTSAGVVNPGVRDAAGVMQPADGFGNDGRLRLPGFDAADWHDYRADWSPGGITFYVDDRWVHHVSRADMVAKYGWVFDDPQFLLLNLAVGGAYPAAYYKNGAYLGVPRETVELIKNGGGRALVDWVQVERLPAAQDRIEAEHADAAAGVASGLSGDVDGTGAVGSVARGDQLTFHGVDFGLGATGVRARVAGAPPAGQVGTVEFRVDSPQAQPFARLTAANTGGWNTWRTVRAPTAGGPAGVHTLYVTFSSPQPWDFVNLNWFSFEPSAPAGRWALDGAGDDGSTRNSPLVTAGGPTWVGSRPGRGRALRFDGVDDEAATAGPVVATDEDFTVSAWVRLADKSAYRGVLSQQGTRTNGLYLAYSRDDDRWNVTLTGSDSDAPAGYPARSLQPPAVNRWTHLAGVFDSAARRLHLYVDGAWQSSVSVPATWRAQGPLTVGRGRWQGRPADFFAGDIDDVEVHERAMAAGEVRSVAQRVEGRWSVPEGSRDFPTTTGPVVATDHSFTVTAWVRLDRADANYTAVAQDGGRVSAFLLQYHHGHRAWAFQMPTADVDRPTLLAAANSAPKVGVWTHLAGSYDATTQRLRLWVDGELVAAAGTPPMWRSAGPLTIGHARFAGRPVDHWPGEIGDVQAYSGVLDSGTVAALAARR